MAKSNEANWKSSSYRKSDYFDLPNPGLESYFAKTDKGNSEEYRTTFFKGKSLQDVLAMWRPTLSGIGREWPTLLEFENDLASKVGPLSIQKPLAERLGDVKAYYDDILLPSKPIPPSAISAVVREWTACRGMQIRSQQRTVDEMKKSTSSGNPYFVKRRLVVDKTLPVSLEIRDPDKVIQTLNGQEWLSTAILGWRGQEGGPTDEDVKQRVIWMFPFGVNIEELRMYQPAIELAQRYELVPAWVGMESVDKRITKLFDTKGRKDLIICTDFKRFDQHFNSDMQAAAKTIIADLLTPTSDNRRWISETFPIKYMIPLILNGSTIYTGKHGMASGSGGTNFDETIVHRSLQYEVAQSIGSRLNPNSMCLGDDGILSAPGLQVKDVIDVYSSHGQVCNPEKQYSSTQDCTYLRRWHHNRYRIDDVCVGVYSTYRALGRLCEQERYYDPEVWGPKMVALRQLSILNNCEYHPLKEQFVDFCMKGDKYRLGIDIPGFLDNIGRIAQDAIDLIPDFLGYTQSLGGDVNDAYGIENWWIVKYLRSKSK